MKKNNNIIILLMGIIIVILAVLCVLFATDTIQFKSDKITNNQVTSTNGNNSDSNQNNYDAEKIAKEIVPTMLSLANQHDIYTYCGDQPDNTDFSVDNNSYHISTIYDSVDKMKAYLLSIMDESIVNKYFVTGTNRYIEKENKLYCSYLPTDGLATTFMSETSINSLGLTYLINKKTTNQFNVTVSFVYNSEFDGAVDKKYEYNISFEKRNSKWIITSYEEK